MSETANEYPKALYGKKGWDDLNDHVIVNDSAEEETARKDGYSDLGKQGSGKGSRGAPANAGNQSAVGAGNQ